MNMYKLKLFHGCVYNLAGVEKEQFEPLKVPEILRNPGVSVSIKNGELHAQVEEKVDVDVVQAHTRSEAMSDKKWFDGKHTFREVFQKADRTEQQEVFEASGSFKWDTLKPIREWRVELKGAPASIVYYNTIRGTKGAENVAAGDLSKLKAKSRTVVYKELDLHTMQPSKGLHQGERMKNRCASVPTTKTNFALGIAQKKQVGAVDQKGAYPTTVSRGVFCIGVPPKHYIDEEILKKWEQAGYKAEELACETPQSNYGRFRAGFDFMDQEHETKLKDGWSACDVPGLYVRNVEGAKFPDHVTGYVDDDAMCCEDLKGTLAAAVKNRTTEYTTQVLSEEQSIEYLGVERELFTFTEKELGFSASEEEVRVEVCSQPALASSVVDEWRSLGYPLKFKQGPAPAGAVLPPPGGKPGKYASECLHWIGCFLYLVQHTREDLAYITSLLGSGAARWTVEFDALLEHAIGYLASSVKKGGFNVSSKRELENGEVRAKLQTDASFAGHADMRGHTHVRATLEGRITRILLHHAANVGKGVSCSSGEEEVKAIYRGTRMFIPIVEAAEAMMGQDLKEELETDAAVALAAVQAGLSAKLAHMKRHAGIRFAWVSEYWTKRASKHRSGEELVADWGTKSLTVARFLKLRALAGMV